MTALVKCPACGIKTNARRPVCPRCKASLTDVAVCETTAAVPAHLRSTLAPDTEPLRRSDTGPSEPDDLSEPDPSEPNDPSEPDDTDAAGKSVFDTDISTLFPRRRRFGVIDLLLVAGLIAWLVVLSDMRVWVNDGVISFATGSAMAGASRVAVAVPTAPEDHPMPAADDGDTPGEAVPGREPPPRAAPLPPAAVSMGAGNQLFDTGEFPSALAQFEAAVAVAPDDPQARNNLGQTLVRLKRQNEAVPHLEEAVRLDPRRWEYHFNLAHTLGELGWWSRSAAQYRQAAELLPSDFATRYNLGRALHEWGDYRGAVVAYLEAIALAPGEPTFYLSLAQSYDAMARPADVVAAYARYLEIDSASTRANQVRAQMDALQHANEGGPGPAENQ